MSFCSDCGAQNTPTAKFCAQCGHPMTGALAP
ncbi:MAG: zinc-ribbon domain-containing protein, partial [Caldilineaceae bacterium]|nr:zinc-ribbon domain-containing protein [Caldilineaceae bacterium]